MKEMSPVRCGPVTIRRQTLYLYFLGWIGLPHIYIILNRAQVILAHTIFVTVKHSAMTVTAQIYICICLWAWPACQAAYADLYRIIDHTSRISIWEPWPGSILRIDLPVQQRFQAWIWVSHALWNMSTAMQGVRLPCIQELHYDRGVPFSFTEKFPFDLALSESLRTLCLRFNFNELDFGWNTNFIGHWTDPVRCRPAMLKKLVVENADFTIVSDGMNSLRHVVNLEELRVSSLMSISSISNPYVSLLSPYTHLTR